MAIPAVLPSLSTSLDRIAPLTCPRGLRFQLAPKQPEFLAMPTAAKKATARNANPTDAVSHLADVTDRMHGLLMDRADALKGCLEGSPEEAELAALTDVIEAYERQRWPQGRILGGKG